MLTNWRFAATLILPKSAERNGAKTPTIPGTAAPKKRQLNVIDDASGQTIDYAWTNPEASAIGVNLGWLQVGFTQAGAAQE